MSQPKDALARLDESSPIFLRYLAEGAANVVYYLCSSPDAALGDDDFEPDNYLQPSGVGRSDLMPDVRFKGKLLRLRKAIPSAVSVIDAQQKYESLIRPLFMESSIVGQELCDVSRGLLEQCNGKLRQFERESSRNVSRFGVYLNENEHFGILINDMSYDEGHVSVEFKPKWLVQSPSAPADSQRCRTCAMRARKRSKAKKSGLTKDTDFCPLALTHNSMEVFSKAAESLVSGVTGPSLEAASVVDKLSMFLYKNPLLQHLKDLQMKLDREGPLQTNFSEDFSLAMTIRDCTLFLKVRKSRVGIVQNITN